jgi:hypothetical protein
MVPGLLDGDATFIGGDLTDVDTAVQQANTSLDQTAGDRLTPG